MEGRVLAGGQLIKKPGDLILEDSKISLRPVKRYVSRGGYKLEGVFEDLDLNADGRDVVDVGSSTGGFTDFLLQNGARSVTAIDVGKGLLSWKLRNNEKVRVLENTNIRYLDAALIDHRSELAVVDVSFISIKKIFIKILEITSTGAGILLLVKPQFELESRYVRHKGVVRERKFHRMAVRDMVSYLKDFKVIIEGITFSKIKGASGNIEFWIYLRKSTKPAESGQNYDKIIDDAVDRSHKYFNRHG